MDLTSTLSPSLKLILIVNSALTDTIQGRKGIMQIVASPRSQKLLIVPLLNLLEALVCAGGGDSARCFHYSALSSFLPPITFRLSVTVQSGKKKGCATVWQLLCRTHTSINQIPRVWDNVLYTVDVWGWVAVFLGDPPCVL